MEECAELEIKHVWMYRGPGAGSVSAAATHYGRRQGITVIMTTHILEVAERMAERIGVINHGRLVAEGTLAELRARIGRETTLEEIFLDLVAQKEMDADPAVAAVA